MRHEFLHSKLRQVAKKICPDYPGISECSAWEQLYAIASIHEGYVLAIGDLHFAIENLIAKSGMSDEEGIEYLEQLFKQRIEGTNDI